MEPIDNRHKEWKQATVTKDLGRNTYEVFDGSKFFKRNRQFLRKRKSRIPIRSIPSLSSEKTPLTPVVKPQSSASKTVRFEPLLSTMLSRQDSNQTPKTDTKQRPRPISEAAVKPNTLTTRSGRTIKQPDKLVIVPGPNQKY